MSETAQHSTEKNKREPEPIVRMDTDGIRPMAVFYVLCGKDITKPIEEYQSPQILKIIGISQFSAASEKFKDTHRNFCMAAVYEPAAQQIAQHIKEHPSRPLRLESFIFSNGAAYSTFDYGGA